ncbi:unnamed protein product [Rotaria magnacalcarata]|uniref:Uncharacterized protein n=1 Tax=Rotaria magnacalcarata TaxID=392030 RepID=A0A8S2K9N6_9BILA|nr:unnamed protein product [Rotaria magnacalcarata]CAF3869067.1 unnamed protein product [Rotaria magnacalcarata]
MLTFSVDRQLITTTLKPNREKDEIASAEATLVYHAIIDFIHDSSESAIDIHRNARQILDKYELNLSGNNEIDTLIEKPNVNEKNDAKNLSEFLSDFEGKIPGLSGFRRPNSGFSTVASGNPEHVVNNNIK